MNRMQPSSIECPPEERLQLLLTGSLSEDIESELETHISQCTVCERRLDTLSSSDDLPKWKSLRKRTNEIQSQVSVQTPSSSTELVPHDLEMMAGLKDRFELVDVAGRGGMGTVYKAKSRIQGMLRAEIKQLDQQNS